MLLGEIISLRFPCLFVCRFPDFPSDYRALSILFLVPKFKNPESIRKQHKQSIIIGNVAYFSCDAEGSPTPSIRWYKDKDLISKSSDKFSLDGYTLKIKSTAVSHEGHYRCVVSNYHGNISANFTLVTEGNSSYA